MTRHEERLLRGLYDKKITVYFSSMQGGILHYNSRLTVGCSGPHCSLTSRRDAIFTGSPGSYVRVAPTSRQFIRRYHKVYVIDRGHHSSYSEIA